MNADYLDFSVEEQEVLHLIMHRQNKTKMGDGTEPKKQNKRKMQSN